MLIDGDRESENVQDRRGIGGRGMAVGGGVGTLIIALVIYLLGGNPRAVLNPGGAGGGGGGQYASSLDKQTQDKWAHVAKVVLALTEDVWQEQLPRQTGRRYTDPTLELFTGQTQTACGGATSAVGPFYCPGDRKLYLDLEFFDELDKKFHAPGDFAQAYVIAHEVGHHVQNILGATQVADDARRTMSEVEANKVSVKLELQADFYAGVWAHYAQEKKHFLEPGDIDEAIRAAGAVGDDTLQRRAGRRVATDSFTHGSSADRIAAFREGFETGDMRKRDPFGVFRR
jgi:predicted metalloprotease